MEVYCDQCGREIEPSNVNVEKDTVYCRHCEALSSLSSRLPPKKREAFDHNALVDGVTIDDRGMDWSISASHRSWYALFLVPFSMVWVGGSMGGIYGTQFLKGQFDPGISAFGIPFIIGSIVLSTVSLMSLFGKSVVRVRHGKASVFMGLGWIGWTRRFDWRDIEHVEEVSAGGRRRGHISLEGARRYRFGWGITGARCYCVVKFLISKLAH